MMAVRIFFKHLFTGIRRRPAQPILLTIVVALAVVVCTMTLSLLDIMVGEIEGQYQAEYGNSNITVTVGGSSDVRFIDPEKAIDVLPADSDVCGTYSLPFYCGKDNAFYNGVLTDLYSVNGIFGTDVRLPARYDALKTSILVTKDFAKKYNLSIGSEVTMLLFGKSINYEVQGIYDKPLLGGYSVMVDKTSVISAIAGGAMLGDLITPYGKLFIHVTGNVNDAAGALKEVYPDFSVNLTAPDTASLKEDFRKIPRIFVLVLTFLSMIAVYCCFSILTTQRTEENGLLYAVGAKEYMLVLLSMAELVVYWFLGSLIGGALSDLVADGVGAISGFKFSNPTIKFSAVATASGLMLLATEVCMLMYSLVAYIKKFVIRKGLKKSIISKKGNLILTVISGCLLITSVAMIVKTSTTIKREMEVYAIPTLVILLVCAFFTSKTAFKYISAGLSKNKKLSVPISYGIKNSGRVESQSNVAALTTVIICVFLVCGTLFAYCIGTVNVYSNIVDADYVVINATEKTQNAIAEVDGVEGVFRAMSANAYDKSNREWRVLSTTDSSVFIERFNLPRLPSGNEVFFSKTTFDNYHMHVGDKYKISLDKENYISLVIVGTFDANDRLMIVNAEDLKMDYNFTAVKFKDGFNKDKVYQDVFEACKMDNVIITDVATILGAEIDNLKSYSLCLGGLIVIVFVFIQIAQWDSIISGYRSRREEFDCYAGAGMNKKTLRQMKVAETAYSFLVGLIMAAIFAFPTILMVYDTILGYSANILFVI